MASALAAQRGGAGRIELCGALELGGITPSHGVLAMTRDALRLPLFVLVRPRGGDFVYTDEEFVLMERDIDHCRSVGCDGVVIGALTAHGSVDTARCAALVAAAGGMEVTFHRAVDMAVDALAAVDAVVALGCRRVLTSGGQASALSGAQTIRAMVERAAGRLTVMAGAGIDSRNIATVAAHTGVTELHASAKRRLPSGQPVRPTSIEGMAAGEWRTDEAEVRAMVGQLLSGTKPA
jgi:copper homeostasis protein